MAYPSRQGRFHLYVDAALGDEEEEGGLGAALFQEQQDGSQRPVAYASRQLQSHEKNYSPFLIELRAVVYGLETFHHHLFGRSFTVYTDHKPITNLSKVHTKTLNRLQEEMLKYHFDIKHIPGPNNPVADFLSRNPETNPQAQNTQNTDIDLVEQDYVAKAQLNDPELRRVIKEVNDGTKLTEGWHRFPGEFIVFNGILHFQPAKTSQVITTNPIKLVVPKSLQDTIAKDMHASQFAGHSGFFKTRSRARDLYWWPHMDNDIERICAQCITCNRMANKYQLRRQPTVERDLPNGPNDRVHVDLFGPLQACTDSGRTKKYVMVMTDAFTKLAILRTIPNKLAETTAKTFLEAWVYTFGVPKTVITDQGNEFKGLFDATLLVTLQSKHIATTPYHPQSNGQAEVFNRTMAHYLRTMIEDCNTDTLDWEAYIMPLQFSYNTSIHSTTMTTPFFAHFGYDPLVPLWKRKDKATLDQTIKFNDPVSKVLQVNHRIHNHIRERLPAVRQTQDFQYNTRHHTDKRPYQVGDRVWVTRLGIPVSNPKLAQKWEEAIILKIFPNNSVKVSRYNRSKHKDIVIHVDNMRPMLDYTPPDTNATATSTAATNPQTGDGTTHVQEVDPTDMPTLEKLYQGQATSDDIQLLLNKGYVIVFPQGTIIPDTLPGPGPRAPLPAIQSAHQGTQQGPQTESYEWQRQAPIRRPRIQPRTQTPDPEDAKSPETVELQSQRSETPIRDKLSRLAKQLAIPKGSRFVPATTIPERNLRSLSKLGDKIRQAPTQLKEAYLKSGERELNRLSDAAIEIFYKNQRKHAEKLAREEALRIENERIFLSQVAAYQDRKRAKLDK